MKIAITSGFLILHYCFDVASEVDMEGLEKLFGKKAEESRLDVKRIAPEYIQYRVPPLRIKLGNRQLNLGDEKLDVIVDVKVYNFGAMSLRYWIPIKGSFKSLVQLSAKFVENDRIDSIARVEINRLMGIMKDVISGPSDPGFETYAVFYITNLDKKVSANTILAQNAHEIARMLCCEERDLDKQELDDAVKNPLSYFPDDLVLIDWNAALIYDPRNSYEALDVIEYAVIELLELRTYDVLLDKSLQKAYDDIRKRSLVLTNPLGRVLNDLSAVRIEVSDVIDKVENSLKMFGDLYLVKVYNAAAQRFYLEKWKVSVRNKLNTVMDTYTMLSEKREAQRMFILELSFVALFIIEIFLFFWD